MPKSITDDQACLKLFVARVERVVASEYLDKPVNWTIEINRGQPVRQSVQEPSDVLLESFVTRIRPILSKKEPVFLGRIYNICDRRLTDEKLRGWLRESRGYWLNAHNTSSIHLNVNGLHYPPDKIADLWLNGFYFHDDLEKVKELEMLARTGLQIPKVGFHDYLSRCYEQVFYTGDIVKKCLNDGRFNFS